MEASDYEFEDETRPAKVNSFFLFIVFETWFSTS